MTKKKTLFITIFILLAVLGIGMTSFKQVSVGNLLGSTDVQEREFMEIDCTAGNPNCPRLAISGDFADKSKFHGFADPSMRRDPNSGIIWLAYSWPHVVRSGSGLWSWFSRPDVAVDIHLARSNDGGASWKYAGQLWQAHTVLNPVTKVNNIVSYETANISAQNKNGKTIWHAIHWDYLLKPGGFIYSQIGRYSYFRLSMVSSPYRLASARSQILGFGGTANELNPDVNLTSLHPGLADCKVWTEPALTTQGDRLYLAARCLHFLGAIPLAKKDFYAVFSTDMRGDIKRWIWKYNGKIAGSADAADLDNHQFLTQFDFAQKSDGRLLAVMTPADAGGPQGEMYYDCRVLQVSSLNPPALSRDAYGKLKVFAKITASDLTAGNGACAYDPSAKTGLIITRKLINDPKYGYYWTLHKTGLKP